MQMSRIVTVALGIGIVVAYGLTYLVVGYVIGYSVVGALSAVRGMSESPFVHRALTPTNVGLFASALAVLGWYAVYRIHCHGKFVHRFSGWIHRKKEAKGHDDSPLSGDNP
jgi:hypothetical protein